MHCMSPVSLHVFFFIYSHHHSDVETETDGNASVSSNLERPPRAKSRNIIRMTKSLRKQLSGAGGVVSRRHKNERDAVEIGRRVGRALQGVQVNQTSGMTPHRRFASTTSYAAVLSLEQRSKATRRRRNKATIEREHVSPVKRANDTKTTIIEQELKLYTCHASIWSQKTKTESGDFGLTKPLFDLKLLPHDGSLSKCPRCSEGPTGHNKLSSRQCKLHCFTHMNALTTVLPVREYVVEFFACKVSAMAQLLVKWAGITERELNTCQNVTLPSSERDSARKSIKLKLDKVTSNCFYVPQDTASCSGVSGWGPEVSDNVYKVCQLGFHMFTGISLWRIKAAIDLVKRGSTSFISKAELGVRRTTSEDKSLVYGQGTSSNMRPNRTIWIRTWLQTTLPPFIQTHANGQKRIQDASFSTPLALARAAIDAFWTFHVLLEQARRDLLAVKFKIFKNDHPEDKSLDALVPDPSWVANLSHALGLHAPLPDDASSGAAFSGCAPPVSAVAAASRALGVCAPAMPLVAAAFRARPGSIAVGAPSWVVPGPGFRANSPAAMPLDAASSPVIAVPVPVPAVDAAGSASGSARCKQVPAAQASVAPDADASMESEPGQVDPEPRQASRQAAAGAADMPACMEPHNCVLRVMMAPSADGLVNMRDVNAINTMASLVQQKKMKGSRSKADERKPDKELEKEMYEKIANIENSNHEHVSYLPANAQLQPGDAVMVEQDFDERSGRIAADLQSDASDYGLKYHLFLSNVDKYMEAAARAVSKPRVVQHAVAESVKEMKKEKLAQERRERQLKEQLERGDDSLLIEDDQRLKNLKSQVLSTSPFVKVALAMNDILKRSKRATGASASSPDIDIDTLYAAMTGASEKSMDPLQAIETSFKLPSHLKQISVKTVFKILREDFADLVFPQACDLGTCTDCGLYSRKLAFYNRTIKVVNRTLTEKELLEYEEFMARYQLHKLEHTAERVAMLTRIENVLANPSGSILVIYDYSKSLYIPKFIRSTKDQLEHQNLEIKIAAIIVYANGRRYNYIFLHDATLPKGANTMMTMLYSVIRYHLSFGEARQAKRLYMQCDGGSENISFTPFGMIDFFVRLGWFESVELYRLPVGHSHQLIDAFFSAISRAYNKGCMTSIAGIIQRLNETWDGGIGHPSCPEDKVWNQIVRPQFVFLNTVLDFHSLMRAPMNKILNIRSRVLGWLFERSGKAPDARGYWDVDLWYMVSPALDVQNGRNWRGCNGVQRLSSTHAYRPLKLFDVGALVSADGIDIRGLAPGNIKLGRDQLCGGQVYTDGVSLLLQLIYHYAESNTTLL